MPGNRVFLLFFFFFLFLVVSSQSGEAESFKHRTYLLNSGEDEIRISSRKLLDEEMVQLDYDYAGPNPKHSPRRGGGRG